MSQRNISAPAVNTVPPELVDDEHMHLCRRLGRIPTAAEFEAYLLGLTTWLDDAPAWDEAPAIFPEREYDPTEEDERWWAEECARLERAGTLCGVAF